MSTASPSTLRLRLRPTMLSDLEGELHATLDKLRKEGTREGAWSIGRFKGLGEMNAEQQIGRAHV